MALDTKEINQAITDLTAQVAATEGVEDSAGALISGFSAAMTKAVTDALVADNSADQTTIDSIKQVMADVTTRFKASSDKLGTAVTANSGGGQ